MATEKKAEKKSHSKTQPRETINQSPLPKKGIVNKKQGEEAFDVLGRMGGHDWCDNRHDYLLIAEVIGEARELNIPTASVTEFLGETNKFVKCPNNKYIFDGTIRNLKFLIKNGFLNIDDIEDAKLGSISLKELLERYSKQVTIDEIFDELSEGKVLKSIAFENPKLIHSFAKLPQGKRLKELIPKDKESLERLVGGDKKIEMNPDRWSPQAMRCKAVQVGLYLANGKIFLPRSSGTVQALSSLKEDDIDKRNEEKLVFVNSLWIVLASAGKWNKNRNLNFQEILRKDCFLIQAEGTFLSLFYDNYLAKIVQQVANKYFKNFDKNHPAYFAVINTVVIILYRMIDYISQGSRHPSFRIDGFLNKGFEYIFTKKFKLQKWFKKYFESELDKRVYFISLLQTGNISTINFMKRRVVIYLPVFESFRFFSSNLQISLIPRLIGIFHNKSIPLKIKNDIVKSIVFNVQKIIVLPKGDEYENGLKDKFIILLLDTFTPLIKKISDRVVNVYGGAKSYCDYDDVKATADEEMLNAILKYDATINPNFLGYIKKCLPLNVRSATRGRKMDFTAQRMEREWLENLPSPEDLEKQIQSEERQREIRECLSKLTPKTREAIEKAYYRGEKLDDKERKAKNRGLEKLRKIYGAL